MQIHQNYLTITTNNDESISDIIKTFHNVVKQNKFVNKEGEIIYDLACSSYPIPSTDTSDDVKTKWEEFAAVKGIKKRKKPRMVYSEKIGELVPTYGSRSEKNMLMRAGITEASESFSKLRNEKKKRILKNQKNQKANLKRNKK